MKTGGIRQMKKPTPEELDRAYEGLMPLYDAIRRAAERKRAEAMARQEQEKNEEVQCQRPS